MSGLSAYLYYIKPMFDCQEALSDFVGLYSVTWGIVSAVIFKMTVWLFSLRYSGGPGAAAPEPAASAAASPPTRGRWTAVGDAGFHKVPLKCCTNVSLFLTAIFGNISASTHWQGR